MNMSSAGTTDVLDGIQRRRDEPWLSSFCWHEFSQLLSPSLLLLKKLLQRNRWASICCCCCCCSGLDRKTWIRLQNKYQRTRSSANRPCLSDSDLRTFPEDQRFCSKISKLPLPDMTAGHADVASPRKSFFCWISSDPGAGRDWSLASYPANRNNPLKEIYCVSTACKHTFTHLVCSSRCGINHGTALLSTNTKLSDDLLKNSTELQYQERLHRSLVFIVFLVFHGFISFFYTDLSFSMSV